MKKNYAGIDLHDFNFIKNPKGEHDYDQNNFVRFANDFIQDDITETYKIHRVFLTVYYLIDKHRNTLSDTSYLIISEIFELHRVSMRKNKTPFFYEIVKCIMFLSQSNMIEITSEFDVDKISYNTPIIINVLNNNFDPTNSFTMLTYGEFDSIMSIKSKVNKENLLVVFLYLKSFIFSDEAKKKSKQNEEIKQDYFKNMKSSKSFFTSIENAQMVLGISKHTINSCLNALTSFDGSTSPLLIKHDVGSIIDPKTQKPKNIPNIYVLNKAGYQHEINLTLENLKQKYKVEKFFKKSGNYN